MNYEFDDYKKAVKEMGAWSYGSCQYEMARMKAMVIAEALLKQGSKRMAMEIMKELDSLYDCAADQDDKDVQMYLWMLGSNGFKELADEARKYWEV